jgi:oxygen-independent coproporphyrinogen-3 oxidase
MASLSTRPTATNVDLVEKYSIAGPRYTSYPPANLFSGDFRMADVEMTIEEDNALDAGPLSLYFHLPFCESLCWYCGCNTVITRNRGVVPDYLDYLLKEVDLTAERVSGRRSVEQVHLGGGTPTFLAPDELAELGMLIQSRFKIGRDCEFSVEIDPRTLTKDHVEALRVIGANRASLGIQDTDPKVQIAIHRWQPKVLNAQAMAWLREAGFESVNVDLIYGLPLQTTESFSRTIDDIMELKPDRLSVFGYAHVPWVKPAQRIFDDRHELPGPQERVAMFALAHEKLRAAGYVDIGLDHFALPDDELATALSTGGLQRGFQGYSTKGGTSLYGFGISSISSTERSYRQNFKDLSLWKAALDRGDLPVEKALFLTREDIRRRALIMRIMCTRGLDYASLSEELGVDVAKSYSAEIEGLADLEADGILSRSESGIEVLPNGWPLLRVVAMRFDATITGGADRHSRAV